VYGPANERGFTAQEHAKNRAERSTEEREYEHWQQRRSTKQRSGLN
jgi:hypothetical protein